MAKASASVNNNTSSRQGWAVEQEVRDNESQGYVVDKTNVRRPQEFRGGRMAGETLVWNMDESFFIRSHYSRITYCYE